MKRRRIGSAAAMPPVLTGLLLAVGLAGAVLSADRDSGKKGRAPEASKAVAAPRAKQAVTNVTVITSERLTYDDEKRHALFEEKVHVTDNDVTLDADSMKVRFSADNAVEHILAVGNVRIAQQDRVATCSTASCDVATGIVVLAGDAEMRRGKDATVKGNKITIMRKQGVMLCEPAKLIMVDGSGGQGGLRLLP